MPSGEVDVFTDGGLLVNYPIFAFDGEVTLLLSLILLLLLLLLLSSSSSTTIITTTAKVAYLKDYMVQFSDQTQKIKKKSALKKVLIFS